MKSFLCRVMAFVFVLNIACPASNVWGQEVLSQQAKQYWNGLLTNPSSSTQSGVNLLGIHQTVDEKLEEKIAGTKNDLARAAERLIAADSVCSLQAAISEMHTLGEKLALAEMEQNGFFTLGAFHFGWGSQSQEEEAEPVRPSLMAKSNVPDKRYSVIELLKENKLELPSTVDFIDPFDFRDATTEDAIYAAEVLGTTVEAALESDGKAVVLDDNLRDFLNDFLPMAQLRILHQLNKIGAAYPAANVEEVMLVGTLRMTMWKLNQYYVKTKQTNPVYATQEGESSCTYWGNAAQLSGYNTQFLQELTALKNKDLEEGDAEYALLLVLSDYATAYAMMSDEQRIAPIVDLFDSAHDKDADGDLLQQYSSVLNQVFTVIFESNRYSSTGTDRWVKILNLLLLFSKPTVYSVPVRVAALETAGLLMQPHDAQTVEQEEEKNKPGFHAWMLVKSVIISGNKADAMRTTFASRTVDLYASLNYTHFAAIEDYGLDSEQMAMFANKLADIYNNFANDDLQWDSTRKHMKGSYVLDKAEDGTTLILNKGNSIPRLLDTRNGRGYQHQLPNMKTVTIGGFGRTSSGMWVEMSLKNGLNPKKVRDEYNAKFARLVGEAALWIYGGEVFSLIGTAYRVTRGALAAMPSAVKAFSTAQKGARWATAAREIRMGARFGNLTQYLESKYGIKILMTRTEKVKSTVAKAAGQTEARGNQLQLAAPAGTKIPKTPRKVDAPVTRGAFSMNHIRNRRWWFGMRGRPEITNITLQQTRPGFQVTYGEVTASAITARLKNGLHSWKDMEFMMANLTKESAINLTTTLTPGFRWYENFAWLNAGMRQVATEQSFISATARNLAADANVTNLGNGAFNYWKFTEKGWVRVSQQDFMAAGRTLGAKADEIVNYYEVLGVSRGATEAEIRAIHLSKVKPLREANHAGTNKLLSDEEALLNAARDVLVDPVKRAAHDSKLGLLWAKSTHGMAVTPEGYSLAITRNQGAVVAEGFNPLANEGLGIGAGNFTEDLSSQLTHHLLQTKQMDALRVGSLFTTAPGFNAAPWKSAMPLYSNFNSNLAFFAGLEGLDWLTYRYGMEPWITNLAATQVENAKTEYGDTFDPEKQEEDKAASERSRQDFLANGGTFLPGEINTLDAVKGSAKKDDTGSFISMPFLMAKHYLFGGVTLLSDRDRGMMDYFSVQVQGNRAQREKREMQKKQTQELLLQWFSDQKQQYQRDLSALPFITPADIHDLNTVLDKYKAKFEALFQDKEILDSQLATKQEALWTECMAALSAKISEIQANAEKMAELLPTGQGETGAPVSYTVESLQQLANMAFLSLEQGWQEYIAQSSIPAELFDQVQEVIDQYRGKVQTILASAVSNDEKYVQISDLFGQLNGVLADLAASAQNLKVPASLDELKRDTAMLFDTKREQWVNFFDRYYEITPQQRQDILLQWDLYRAEAQEVLDSSASLSGKQFSIQQLITEIERGLDQFSITLPRKQLPSAPAAQ